MSTTKIVVPDFQFSGFYYAQILRRVRLFDRINVPEITSETTEEPFIQLERAFSLVGHQCNVLLDLAANELLVPTLKLQESARRVFRLIDFYIRDYAPATVDLLAELVQVLTASTTVVEAYSVFETDRTEDEEAVPFEVEEAVVAGPTNVFDVAFSESFDRTGADGATVFGDPDAFESATLAAAGGDVGSIIQIGGSVLGNNGIWQIVEVLTAGSPGVFRLAAVDDGDDPLFIFETGLTWTIRTRSSNQATAIATAGAPFFTPWSGVVAGDKIYLASKYVMLEEAALAFQTLGANISGVWEYYDPDHNDENPDSVANMGTYLYFEIDGLLDPDSVGVDARGALVKVTHLASGTFEILESAYAGVNYINASAFLGQSGTPSTTAGDYAVGVTWNPFEGLTDGTANLSADGDVEFTLPQTPRASWEKSTILGIEGFYLRFRVISVAGPTDPVIDTADPSGGTQYMLLEATQGETVTTEPTQSSNGQPSQSFVLATKPGLRDTVEAYVDEGGGEVEWTNVTAAETSILTCGPKDRCFVVDQDSLGELTVRFGDGTHGRVPPLGVDNLRFVYRANATDDGNVGVGTVVVNSTGAALIDSVTNPRAAYGWREADGASEESLALVKEEGPASLRTLRRAVNPGDYEDLAVAFVASSGARPIIRAKAIEEGYGPKTIKLVVVGVNGVQISGTIKDELEEYFNGIPEQGVEGVGQSNNEVTVVNFAPLSVALTIVIEANSALTETLVKTTLSTLVSPTAKASNGTAWVWRFGGRVPLSRIEAEVFQISPGNVFDVDVTVPTADLELAETGLPILDVASLSISIVAPS